MDYREAIDSYQLRRPRSNSPTPQGRPSQSAEVSRTLRYVAADDADERVASSNRRSFLDRGCLVRKCYRPVAERVGKQRCFEDSRLCSVQDYLITRIVEEKALCRRQHSMYVAI